MYEWAEHVGEVELRVHAEREAGVFAEAARALGELLGGDEGGGGAPRSLEVAAEAEDRAGLLAAWLEELAFLAETEGFVALDADEIVLDDRRVRARVAGVDGSPPHLVKAVTYHRLSFEPAGSGWRAVVVLDV
jgi:SHS2 domain-containing protein